MKHTRHAGVAVAAAALFAASACDKGAPKTDVLAEPAYVVKDSTADGWGVLRRNDVVIDTVDVAFGTPRVGSDSLVFLRKTGGRHVLYDGRTGLAVDISTLVPDFDDRFSAPSVIDAALMYWGIHHGATPAADSVRAVRYEFKRKRLNPLPVSPARLDTTRGRFYFTPPYLEGKEIVFKAPTGEWRFRTPKQ